MESSVDDERRFRGNSKTESSSRRVSSDVEYLFPSSVNREDNDEEEALKWAAIQRLPTVARLRTGLWMTSEGQANEIDIHHLKQEEKKFLLERLVRIADVDNEKFLLKLRDRVHR
ncbi:variant 2, transcription factor [Lathyrus oleraceus]|nr:variant 2, transcription factor [Pisum sativum]